MGLCAYGMRLNPVTVSLLSCPLKKGLDDKALAREKESGSANAFKRFSVQSKKHWRLQGLAARAGIYREKCTSNPSQKRATTKSFNTLVSAPLSDTALPQTRGHPGTPEAIGSGSHVAGSECPHS